MSNVVHYRKSEMNFTTYGGPPGKATIARLVGPDISNGSSSNERV